MNNYWAFLRMTPSNDLLGDASALQRRMADDGYLYFREALDPAKVLSLRRQMLRALADVGWVERRGYFMAGRCAITPVREGDDEFFAGYDAVQKLEEFHSLAHDEALVSIMRQVVGETAFPHPLKIARLSFPEHYEISTPPHQDWPNNQGTTGLTAAWVPVGDVPQDLGGLAVLRGSHRWGVLPLTRHLGAGNRQALLPQDMLESCRWVTTEYAAGDVLLFPSTTVHASLHNATEFHMRLSVDFRYQAEGDALAPHVLEPHFGRLSWDDIYRGWRSAQHQYYWRGLDYEVVPFEELPLVEAAQDSSTDVIRRFMSYEERRDARVARRQPSTLDVVAGEVRQR